MNLHNVDKARTSCVTNFNKLLQAFQSKKSLAIISTQRSGSTLVCDYIAQQGIGQPEEHILKFMSVDQLIDFENNNISFLRSRFNIDEYMDWTITNNIFSTKIMANHLLPLINLLYGYDDHILYPIRMRKLLELFRNTSLIFVSRNDLLDQAISRHMAANTGICHTLLSKSEFLHGHIDPNPDVWRKVIFSYSAISREISSLKAQVSIQENFRIMALNLGINVVDIVYEEFINSNFTNSKLQGLIENFGNESLPYNPVLKKLPNQYNEYFKIIYNDVCSLLKEQEINPDSIIKATLAAINQNLLINSDWFDMQSSFIEEHNYV